MPTLGVSVGRSTRLNNWEPIADQTDLHGRTSWVELLSKNKPFCNKRTSFASNDFLLLGLNGYSFIIAHYTWCCLVSQTSIYPNYFFLEYYICNQMFDYSELFRNLEIFEVSLHTSFSAETVNMIQSNQKVVVKFSTLH